MTVSPLATGSYTLLCAAVILIFIFAILCYLGYLSDEKELGKCSVSYFQKDIKTTDPLYSVSITVKDRVCFDGVNDLIFRLRGANRDAPLVLFRDLDDEFQSGHVINVGISIPFEIGDLVDIDIACDNDVSEEGDPLLYISDVFVRKLPISCDGSKNTKPVISATSQSSWKDRAATAMFLTLASNLRTWAAIDTITNSAGSGVIGIKEAGSGREHVLKARDVALSFPLSEEIVSVKKRARLGYRPLHYLTSLSAGWHDSWSDFSKLDHLFVMCLDLLCTFVTASTCFAFGLEKYLDSKEFLNLFSTSSPGSKSIDDFDLNGMTSDSYWLVSFSLVLVEITYVSFICCFIVIPMSLIWCRLFRLIGGKGFEKALSNCLPDLRKKHEFAPIGSSGCHDNSVTNENRLMLRILECRSTHTASCVTSSRRLHMEPMLSNCIPNHLTARSIAYVRTKMTKLRDEEILSGPSGLKQPEVLHESHTQSTDAPQMPQPTIGPDGKGEVLRVARYCERLVQQAAKKLNDNSVIAECFEIGTDKKENRSGPGGGGKDAHMCCPRQCCLKNKECQESFSNSTFFTEEDAASVKEMISNFSLHNVAEDRKRNTTRPVNDDGFRVVADMTSNRRIGVLVAYQYCMISWVTILIGQMEMLIIVLKYGTDEEMDTPNPSGRKTRSSKLLKNTSCGTSDHKKDPPTKSSPRHAKNKSPLQSNGKGATKFATHVKIGRQHAAGTTTTRSTEEKWEKVRTELNDKLKGKKEGKPRKPRPVPAPSGFRDYDVPPDYDSVALTSVLSDDVRPRHKTNPFKGLRIKLGAFMFLVFIQLGEIAYVSLVENDLNKFYVSSDSTAEIRGGPGRMHAALLCCCMCVGIYFLFVVHLIALLSLLIERLMFAFSHGGNSDYQGSMYSMM